MTLPALKPMMVVLYVMADGSLAVNFVPPNDEPDITVPEQVERATALVERAATAIEGIKGKEPEPIYIHDLERSPSKRVH